jgi:hypothetical protein
MDAHTARQQRDMIKLFFFFDNKESWRIKIIDAELLYVHIFA